MGNRAVITVAPYRAENIGIYVHWNGGRDSIEGFLRAARVLGFRCPTQDESYGMARLCQMIGNYFGGTISVGIGVCDTLDTDNGDNGVWLIGAGWSLQSRSDETFDAETAEAVFQSCVKKHKAVEAA